MASIKTYAALVLFTCMWDLGFSEGTFGRDFYVGVLKPYDINATHNITLHITSANRNGKVQIRVPYLQIDTTTKFSGHFKINLPNSIIPSTNNAVEGRGIRVTTDVDVTLLITTLGSADVTETFLALPTTILSSSYIVSSFSTTTYYKSFESNFLVVATEPNTTVSLISTDLGQSTPDVLMDQYDTYLHGSIKDVSGITIRSNKAIAVFSGHEATGVPYGCAYGRYLVDQLMPVGLFGHEFIVPPVSPKSGYVVRIYSAEPNTTICYANATNNGTKTLSESGLFHEILCTNDPLKIQSDKPVQVMLYSTCYSYNSTSKFGDSFMTVVPAEHHYKNTYYFTVPSMFSGDGYLAIMTGTSKTAAGLQLDGKLIQDEIYSYDAPIRQGNYSVRIYNVTAGAHTLENANGDIFGALQYGFALDTDGAYGNIVGMNAPPINTDCGKLPSPNNGIVLAPDGTKYLNQAVYMCNYGYVLQGESTRICNTSEHWSGKTPTCIAKDCGQPWVPNNGQVSTPNGTTFPNQAEYNCKYGYDLQGESTRTCNASGKWNGTNPTCVVKDCGPVSAPSNGNIMTPNGTKYLSQAVYKCNFGYALIGENVTICQASGIWSKSTPTCEAKADRLTCLQCRDVYHTNLCNTVTKCAQGQVCYVEKFTTHNGQVRYNTGCTESKQCNIHHRRLEKRSTNCIECCSSDLCNFAGCGAQGLPDRSHRGPLCYDCAFTYNMDECKTITLCNPYESCSIVKYDWGGLYDQFTSECKSSQCLSVKRSETALAHSRKMLRSTPMCQQCCDNDLCNSYCNVTSQTGAGVAIIG